MAPRRQPDRPRGGDAAEADAGRHAHPRAPRPRPPHRRPRPAALEGAGDARSSSTRPPTASRSGTSTASSSPAASAGEREDEARRPARRAPRRVLPHDRHRVHAHPGHRRAALDPGQGRGRTQPPFTKDAAAPHPRAAERRRGVREVPRHQVRRHQALRARGRRVGDPDPRRDPVGGRRRRSRQSCVHRHGPPRPAQRAGQHRRQELRPDLQGVRGPRRPRLGAGLGRREVPPRRHRQVRQPVGRRHPASSWPPTPATSRPSTRSWSAWCAPTRTSIEPPGLVPGAADPDPRRRRLRRPGRGGRDAWR